MLVVDILTQKGRDVVTLSADETLADAVAVLNEHKIGALVVVDDAGKVVGIISERDIVRCLAQDGGAALMQPISSAMTRKVVTCALNDRLDRLMGEMTRGKFRHLPVVDQDGLVGIISIGDVVKLHIAEIESDRQAMKDYIATG